MKWRKVYRSGRLVNLTDEDVALIENLGIQDQELTPEDEVAIEAEAV